MTFHRNLLGYLNNPKTIDYKVNCNSNCTVGLFPISIRINKLLEFSTETDILVLCQSDKERQLIQFIASILNDFMYEYYFFEKYGYTSITNCIISMYGVF